MVANDIKSICPSDEELSAFIDGDIEGDDRGPIADHLANCATCRKAIEDLNGLGAGLASLGGQQPSPEIWNRIKNAESGSRRDRSTKLSRLVVLTVASVAAAAALLWAFPFATNQTFQPPTQTQQVSALTEVERAEGVYREAIASLEKAASPEHSSLMPETQQIVKSSLDEIDTALKRCRTAVRDDPKNVEAQRALLAAYQQKVDLLTDLVDRRI